MDKQINEWLKTYEPIFEIAQIEDIHYEGVEKSDKNLALQRAGFENLPLKYVTDKGWYRRYQYMLLLKSESEIDIQRLNNLAWLDDLSDWLFEQNNLNNFPKLEGKFITKVDCANALTYEELETGEISVYALQLYVYVRKPN